MTASIEEIGPDRLDEYSQIPIAFMVTSLFSMDSVGVGLGGILFGERAVESPYIKDYDAYDDGGPSAWPGRFDVRNWGFLLAREESRPAGSTRNRTATSVRSTATRIDGTLILPMKSC